MTFNVLEDIRIQLLVTVSGDMVHSATIENKNSRHFTENAQMINFPEGLQQKMNLVAGKFTFKQLLALVKQEAFDLTELNFH